MNLRVGAFEWNKYALATTGFFILFLVSKLNLLPQFPHCLTFLSCPPLISEFRAAMFSLTLIVGGVAGLKASRSFGGRKNFTGRLLFFFSLFMFAFGPVQFFLVYLDALPNPLSNWLSFQVLLPYSGMDLWANVLSFCFPAYALVVSLRSIWDRYDSRSWLIIFFSLAFVLLFVAWFDLAYADAAIGFTTVLDAILWVGIYPILVFVQLAAGVLLLRSLGRWYVSKSITAFVVLYLFVGVLFNVLSGIVFTWIAGFGSTSSASSLNLDLPYFYSQVIGLFPFYLVCMVLSQIRPRVSGPYF